MNEWNTIYFATEHNNYTRLSKVSNERRDKMRNEASTTYTYSPHFPQTKYIVHKYNAQGSVHKCSLYNLCIIKILIE